MEKTKILALFKKHIRESVRYMNRHWLEVLEEEFVMTNTMNGLIRYLKENESSWWRIDWNTYNGSIDSFISGYEVPVKKTKGIAISQQALQFEMYMHRHTYYELDYVVAGSCRYYIGNEKHAFYLHSGEMCVVNPNMAHGIEIQDENDIIIKLFIPTTQLTQEVLKLMEPNRDLHRFFDWEGQKDEEVMGYVLFKPNEQSIEKRLFEIAEEYFLKRYGWEVNCQNYLRLLFTELMRIDSELIKYREYMVTNDMILMRIMKSIKNNYPFITLRGLAEDYHFHENYLSRKIKKETNKTFHQWIEEYRLEEAKRLLLTTNLSVNEISSRVGYVKPGYFYKLFKKKFDKTPGSYRKVHLREEEIEDGKYDKKEVR